MSLAGDLTHHAEQASRRYAGLIDAWRHHYTQATLGDGAGTPRAISRLRDQAYDGAQVFLRTERAVIEDVTREIALQARRDALNDASASPSF